VNDPRLTRLAAILETDRTAATSEPWTSAEAAVAIVLRTGPDPDLLLIRRTQRPGDPWSGHIAFPGGRRDPVDADLVDTALRETKEETGLDLTRDRVIGRLDDVFTPSRLPRMRVAAFVVTAPSDSIARPDPREVIDVRWILIRALQDPASSSYIDIEHEDTTHRFPSLVHDGFTIWGMTHRILSQFLERLRAAGF
jgi:8-oxo-dGTP pyrophosphatase MutT (NUDIX family)